MINTFLRSEPAEHSDIFLKRYWYLCSIKSIAAEYMCSESRMHRCYTGCAKGSEKSLKGAAENLGQVFA